MTQLVVALTVLLITTTAGFNVPSRRANSRLNGRIVGGYDAEEGQFPYQVSIRRAANGNHNCGGSILNSNWILTAAHCVYDSSPSDWFITLGTASLSTGGSNHQISRMVIHESYTLFPTKNDVALLQLQDQIQFSSNVQPIELETEQIEVVGAVVSGWGWFVNGGPTSDHLQYVQSTTLTTSNCQSVYGSFLISNDEICAVSPVEQGACTGDSGGPLVANGKQIGVVSFGSNVCGDGSPDVYARVSAFRSWIEAAMSS